MTKPCDHWNLLIRWDGEKIGWMSCAQCGDDRNDAELRKRIEEAHANKEAGRPGQ